MPYTNPQDVRDLLGVDIETADDAILEEFIGFAQSYIKKYIQIRIIDGKLSGNINSINNTFQTDHAFWADITGDTFITTADFTVYGWEKGFESDPFKRTELSINTFDPIRGIIVLSSAPSHNEYGKLTMDYSYYTKAIDWELLSLVTSWKAAELWIKREEYLVPDRVFFGTTRIFQNRPWRYFEIEVRRLIDKIIALPMNKVAYAKLVFRPRGPEGPEVDTSAARDIRTESRYTPDPEIEDIVDGSQSH